MLDAAGGISRSLVFPYSKRQPTRLQQGGVVAPVTGHVRGELVAPPLPVGRRVCGVDGTGVPEAAVDEHCDASSGEENVWSTAKPRDRCLMEAEPEPAAMQGAA